MRRNTRVMPLFRSRQAANPIGPPFTTSDGVPMAGAVDGFGNQWVSIAVANGAGGVDSLVTSGDATDNQVTIASGGLLVVNRNYAFDGTFWDRMRSASANNMAAVSGLGTVLVNGPGQRSTFSTPAAATQATCNFAAIGGARHIVKSISWSVEALIAQGDLTVVLRDGATGVGAILWAMRAGSFVIGTSGNFGISGLDIVGTAGNAMTLEFTAAPGAGNFESVAMTGIFVQ